MRSLENLFLRRPRVFNILHSLRLVNPASQTIESELRAIEKHAKGARIAFEIGSLQGVSAARIAAAMESNGMLYCIDPWPSPNGKVNPCYSIFQRHIRRSGVLDRIRPVQKFSGEAGDVIPSQIDFAFIDGDHSWTGVETDWRLVRDKLRVGGIVCLHDSLVPVEEPSRQPDSVRFYQEVILADPEFQTINRVHSLAVLRRVAAC